MSKVRGQFRTFEGTLVIADNPFDSSVTATIDMNSIDTRSEDRDNHLRSSDFFSVETHPTMTFQSTSVREEDGDLIGSGLLTIKDVTNPVDLRLEYLGAGSDPYGNSRVGFQATATINRKDWGVTFNVPLDGEKVVIGDKVAIVIAIEAVLRAA